MWETVFGAMGFVRVRRVVLGLVVAAAAVGAAQLALRLPSAGGAARESGGLIVFHQDTGASHSDPFGAIWIARPDGSMIKELRDGRCELCYSSPRLSPDGTKIVYADFVESGDTAVFIMNSDGTRSKSVCVGKCDYPLAWSPNGRQLAVGAGNFRVGIFDLTSRRLRVLSKLPGDVGSFDWSPDGKHLAVASRDGSTLWLIRPDGSDAKIIAHGVVDPRWSPDGTLLLLSRYEAKEKGFLGTGTMPSSGGRVTLIPRLGVGASATWSPDGRQILFSRLLWRGGDGLEVLDRASGRVHQVNPRTLSICDRAASDKYGSGQTYCYDLDWRR